jgi:hypothetical protein
MSSPRPRNPRPRNTTKRKRRKRQLDRFIPRGDSDFALTAAMFARVLTQRPADYGFTDEQVVPLTDAVKAFRTAYSMTLGAASRTQRTVHEKNEARRTAEGLIRQFANVIRANPAVRSVDKASLRIHERTQRNRAETCPAEPPELWFIGSRDGTGGHLSVGGGSGVHMLRFRSRNGRSGKTHRSKPRGATRLELFVDLIAPGEPVPQYPGDRASSWRTWPMYLRSFSTSPIEVAYPRPAHPMLVVYWARWADDRGNVSRFSRTCVARVEGWTANPQALPPSRVEVKDRYVVVQSPYMLPMDDAGDVVIDATGTCEALPDGSSVHGRSGVPGLPGVPREVMLHKPRVLPDAG